MRKSTLALCCGLLATLFAPLPAAAAGTPVVAPTAGGCSDASGVTVVVDLTDLGGAVDVGCAQGTPVTGRSALQQAGFQTTDSPSGMICAISSAPNPCPTTFAGSYWSYWSAQPGSTWTAYAVGADSSHPAAGSFEGWRYNDGSTGPSVLPTAIRSEKSTVAPAANRVDEASPWTTPTEIGVIVLLLGTTLLMVRRRRAARAAEGTDTTTGHRD